MIDFSQLQQLCLRAHKFYICKFEVNHDHATRCTGCWSNLTLKCYATIWESWCTSGGRVLKDYISYLKGYYYSKLYCKKLSNQKPRANKLALQEEELYAECAARLSLGDHDEEKYGNRLIFLIISNGKLPVRMWWQI